MGQKLMDTLADCYPNFPPIATFLSKVVTALHTNKLSTTFVVGLILSNIGIWHSFSVLKCQRASQSLANSSAKLPSRQVEFDNVCYNRVDDDSLIRESYQTIIF